VTIIDIFVRFSQKKWLMCGGGGKYTTLKNMTRIFLDNKLM